MTAKPLIYDLDLVDFQALMSAWDQPSYRAVQIWQGLYQQLWSSAEAFTTLSKELRDRLAEYFAFSHLRRHSDLLSTDGHTQKRLYLLPDDQAIETVLMHYQSRRTLCISTQVGCALGCTFCATGQMGFRRNLSSGEILEQVLVFARLLHEQGERVTNVVLMGMGEPFHNYEASLAAIDRLTHPEGFNLSARRFTVSTVGLIPAIERFTEERRQERLAISLHAAEDDLRASMLPVNNRYPLRELMAACRAYTQRSGRRITFEWALIQGKNDTPEQAHKLADLLATMNCHVNLIPLNPTEGYEGAKSSRDRVHAFRAILVEQGISTTVRVRRGIDIQAGCGQLAERAAPPPAAEPAGAKRAKIGTHQPGDKP